MNHQDRWAFTLVNVMKPNTFDFQVPVLEWVLISICHLTPDFPEIPLWNALFVLVGPTHSEGNVRRIIADR